MRAKRAANGSINRDSRGAGLLKSDADPACCCAGGLRQAIDCLTSAPLNRWVMPDAADPAKFYKITVDEIERCVRYSAPVPSAETPGSAGTEFATCPACLETIEGMLCRQAFECGTDEPLGFALPADTPDIDWDNIYSIGEDDDRVCFYWGEPEDCEGLELIDPNDLSGPYGGCDACEEACTKCPVPPDDPEICARGLLSGTFQFDYQFCSFNSLGCTDLESSQRTLVNFGNPVEMEGGMSMPWAAADNIILRSTGPVWIDFTYDDVGTPTLDCPASTPAVAPSPESGFYYLYAAYYCPTQKWAVGAYHNQLDEPTTFDLLSGVATLISRFSPVDGTHVGFTNNVSGCTNFVSFSESLSRQESLTVTGYVECDCED